MKGVHLRTNNITFTYSCGETDECGVRGLRSGSARFEQLLHARRWTMVIMLHYAAECVTDDVIAKVIHTYPSIAGKNLGRLFEQLDAGGTLSTCAHFSKFRVTFYGIFL
jgi:hypothetical protein